MRPLRARRPTPELRTGSEEQAAVRQVYESAGGIVYSTSDPRTRRADKGISDLLVIFPGARVLLFHESKAGEGRLTPEQKLFGERVIGLTTEFCWGDSVAAMKWLCGR